MSVEKAPSPIVTVADLLMKHVPERLEEAYFRMEYAADIAKHMVETANVAFNSYVIPGYANRDSVPLVMAAALLTVWPEGAETSSLHLIDTLPYMDADTIIHLAKSVSGDQSSSEDMGVYRNPYEVLIGCMKVAQLRRLVEEKNIDGVVDWLTSAELSFDSFIIAKDSLGARVVSLLDGHSKSELAHAWISDEPRDED